MRYGKVFLESIGYEFAPVVVTSAELERRLEPVYRALHLPAGQFEALTGIAERRWWEPGATLTPGAVAAARHALEHAGLAASDLDAVVYGGVCREQFEPATACHVAAALGVRPEAWVYDISNACLGVLNGIVDLANRIELGQMRCGMVVSCETARDINEIAIHDLLAKPAMRTFTLSLATLTGGSGAVAVIVSDGSFSRRELPRLVGGVARSAPEHHLLCRWGIEPHNAAQLSVRQFARTDASSVLREGVALGEHTWKALHERLEWPEGSINKVICHQVGGGHRDTILRTLGLSGEQDFSTYPYLGNVGTVSLPISAALAQERGFLESGERVAFLGIGSGLNCLMLGWDWR